MAFRYMVLKNGWLIFNYGTGIANFRASTGRPGISDPSIEIWDQYHLVGILYILQK